jgi:signal transduction histidine kinase
MSQLAPDQKREEEKKEKTEVLYGVEDAVGRGVRFMSNVKKHMDIYFDSKGASIVVGVDAYRNGYINIRKKGGKIRAFTEITKENVRDCKELMKVVDELRHLDGVKGGVALNDDEYMATTCLEEGKPLTQVIYSNAPEMVKQGQYIFDTLWSKAVPAEHKIREIEEGIEPEKTEVIVGAEHIIDITLRGFLAITKRFDNCADYTGPHTFVRVEPILKGLVGLKNRGILLRFITEITKENVSDCKELMKIVELRHLDNVKGNFGIADGRDYRASANVKNGQSPSQLVRSTVPQFVEQQQYFFETLWEKAMPAGQRIRELQEGVSPESIETITDPRRIQNLAFELASSAKSEILGIFSTSNSFRRQQRAGLIPMLAEMTGAQDVQIRVMTPIDDAIRDMIEKLRGKLLQKIEIRNLEPPLRTGISLLIVDRKYSLAVEVKDDTKETTFEAIGLATYSNSKATVSSYASIFESLWNQAELYERIRQLYEQLKTYSEMQKEFINIAAHELRTPIQPIIGLTEILCQKESGCSDGSSNDTGEYRKLLKIINRNANRLNRLTESLLDVAKIESKSLRLDREVFLLNDVIGDVVADVEKSIHVDKVRLLFLCPGKSIFINADRVRITQAVYNLVSNAVKFSERGTVFVTLEEETNDAGQFVIISAIERFGTRVRWRASRSPRPSGSGWRAIREWKPDYSSPTRLRWSARCWARSTSSSMSARTSAITAAWP